MIKWYILGLHEVDLAVAFVAVHIHFTSISPSLA